MVEARNKASVRFVTKRVTVRFARLIFFFSSRRRHTRCSRDWSSDVCSSDLFLSEHSGERPASTSGGIESAGGQRQEQALGVSRGQEERERPERDQLDRQARSEERRVGKECRARGSPDHLKKKKIERHGEIAA